jgi:hypothetical protein
MIAAHSRRTPERSKRPMVLARCALGGLLLLNLVSCVEYAPRRPVAARAASPEVEILVPVPPPAPRAEIVPPPPRPREIVEWRPGRWHWDGREYVWRPGEWMERPHPAAVWIPGHWVERPRGWVFVPGRWRS